MKIKSIILTILIIVFAILIIIDVYFVFLDWQIDCILEDLKANGSSSLVW